MASSAGTMPNTGRWGWYQDHEGNEFRRVTTLIKKVETDTHALEEWKKRQVLLGAARRNDIVLGVKALGEVPPLGWSQQAKKQLGKWAEECMTAAGSDEGRINGTAVHDLTERVDRGEPIEDVARGLPTITANDLRAYAKLRELNGWKSVEIERTVVCDELEVAGSFDRIDLIPGLTALLGPGTCQYANEPGHGWHGPGELREELPVIVDVKTEGNPLYNGLHIGPQLAIYSRARRMWLPTPEYVAAPCVRQDVAVIVHVRGKAIPYFVDLTAGWEAAQAAVRQLKREQAAKKWFAPVPGIVEPKPAEILTDIAVAAQWASPDRPQAAKPGDLATAMLDASKVTATALGPAPMPRPALDAVREHMAAGGSTTEGVGAVLVSAMDAEQQHEKMAVYGADGMTRWVDAPPTPTSVPSDAEQEKKAFQQAWTAITAATDLEDLSDVYRTWTETLGLAWVGRVAAAGEAKRKQIECPQRALHTAGTCACGWTSEPPF
jgi:hypothetical protein